MTTTDTTTDAPSISHPAVLFDAIRRAHGPSADDRAAGFETLVFVAAQASSPAMRTRARAELARLGCVWGHPPSAQTPDASEALDHFGPDFWQEARA